MHLIKKNWKYIIKNNCVVLMLCLCVGVKAQGSVVVDKIIVRVNNYIVLKSDLEGLYNNHIMGGNSPSKDVKCKFLNRLIMDKMMVAKAAIDSVTVTPEEVELNIDRRIKVILQNIGNSVKELERAYGKTMDEIKVDLRTQVQEQMLSGKMGSLITGDISATPIEVNRFYKSIPSDSLPFYSSSVEVAQLVKVPPISQQQKEKIKDELMKIRERILKGENFSDLARLYSDDPSTQYNQGEMGYVSRGAMVPSYEAMAFKIDIGELSMPFESTFGFHIIQLIDRRGNDYNSRHILIMPSPSEEDIRHANHFVDSLRTEIINGNITFETATRIYSDDKETKNQGGLFKNQLGSSRLPIEELDSEIYFVIDTMKVGQISRPVVYKKQDGKQALRIIFFKKKWPPHQASLKEDWGKLRTATIAHKKEKTLNEWFEKTKSELFITVDSEYNHCSLIK